jgi:hypothetical protein
VHVVDAASDWSLPFSPFTVTASLAGMFEDEFSGTTEGYSGKAQSGAPSDVGISGYLDHREKCSLLGRTSTR